MPDDPIYLKVERANKHIDELHEVVRAFKATNPYRVALKRDAQTGEHIIYVHSCDLLPKTISLIVGDILQNLYSSLDYLAWQLVIAGGIVAPGPNTAFPISKHIPISVDDLKRYNRQVDGMSDEAKQKITALNPYRGKNNSFWRLQKLTNISKHRTLLTVGFAASGLSSFGDLADVAALNTEALQQGSEVARFPADTQNHKDVHLSFDVALHEPEADTLMWPLIVAVRLFYNTVLQSVEQFDGMR
jgi:hypothetical protein